MVYKILGLIVALLFCVNNASAIAANEEAESYIPADDWSNEDITNFVNDIPEDMLTVFSNTDTSNSSINNDENQDFIHLIEAAGPSSVDINVIKNIILAHIEDKKFKCEHPGCNHSYITQGNLTKHIRSKHPEELPYKRPRCAYKTNGRDSLTQHLLTHTGEKPYACPKCAYKTDRKDHLTRHLLTSTEEKPYACLKCAYKTDRKDHLTRHLLTHTEEKPYTCPTCNWAFNQRCNLTTHINHKHKNNPKEPAAKRQKTMHKN